MLNQEVTYNAPAGEDLMRYYIRSQAARLNRDLDWFFDQPDMEDDGDHPLLEEPEEPKYSEIVKNRALLSWVEHDNQNPYSFLCKYFHVLEQQYPTAPPHMREYITESLKVPSNFRQVIDAALAASGPPPTYSYQRQYYTQYSQFQIQQPRILPTPHTPLPDTVTSSSPLHNQTALQTEDTNKFRSPGISEFEPTEVKGPIEVELYPEEASQKVAQRLICKKQFSVDSTASESDSCYLSMNSPLTDNDDTNIV